MENSGNEQGQNPPKSQTSTTHIVLETTFPSVQLGSRLCLIIPWGCHSPSSSHQRAGWRPATSRRRAPAGSTRTGRVGGAVREGETAKYPWGKSEHWRHWCEDTFLGKRVSDNQTNRTDSCSFRGKYFNRTTWLLTKCHLCWGKSK